MGNDDEGYNPQLARRIAYWIDCGQWPVAGIETSYWGSEDIQVHKSSEWQELLDENRYELIAAEVAAIRFVARITTDMEDRALDDAFTAALLLDNPNWKGRDAAVGRLMQRLTDERGDVLGWCGGEEALLAFGARAGQISGRCIDEWLQEWQRRRPEQVRGREAEIIEAMVGARVVGARDWERAELVRWWQEDWLERAASAWSDMSSEVIEALVSRIKATAESGYHTGYMARLQGVEDQVLPWLMAIGNTDAQVLVARCLSAAYGLEDIGQEAHIWLAARLLGIAVDGGGQWLVEWASDKDAVRVRGLMATVGVELSLEEKSQVLSRAKGPSAALLMATVL